MSTAWSRRVAQEWVGGAERRKGEWRLEVMRKVTA
jgi:hypothetical protein